MCVFLCLYSITVKWCDTCMMGCQMCVCSCVYPTLQSNGAIHVRWDARCMCVFLCLSLITVKWCSTCTMGCQMHVFMCLSPITVKWCDTCMIRCQMCHVLVPIPHRSQMAQYMYDGKPDVCMCVCSCVYPPSQSNGVIHV